MSGTYFWKPDCFSLTSFIPWTREKGVTLYSRWHQKVLNSLFFGEPAETPISKISVRNLQAAASRYSRRKRRQVASGHRLTLTVRVTRRQNQRNLSVFSGQSFSPQPVSVLSPRSFVREEAPLCDTTVLLECFCSFNSCHRARRPVSSWTWTFSIWIKQLVEKNQGASDLVSTAVSMCHIHI